MAAAAEAATLTALIRAAAADAAAATTLRRSPSDMEVPAAAPRGLHSSTFQLNLSRVTPPRDPLSNRLGEDYASNVSHNMCLR